MNDADKFGSAMDISGNIAAVSAPYDSETQVDGGAVYLFEWDGMSWTQIAKMTPSDVTRGMLFGSSLHLTDTALIVGAPNDLSEGIESGSAYLFLKPDGGWVDSNEDCKLIPSIDNPNGSDRFGISVRMDNDIVIVGNPYTNSGFSSYGTVYVFENTESDWTGTLTETSIIEGPENTQYFGASVAIDGNVIAATAPGLFADGTVHIYENDGSGWTGSNPVNSLSDTGLKLPGSGKDIILEENLLVIGSPWTQKTRVFTKTGLSWADDVDEAELVASDPGVLGRFGASVALQGEYILVGDPLNSNGSQEVGAAYLFKKSTTGWKTTNELAKFTSSSAAYNDVMGTDVGLIDGLALVGAPGKQSGAGLVYVFEKPVSEWETATETSGIGPTPYFKNYSEYFGHGLAIDGNVALVRSLKNREVNILEKEGDTWVQKARLTASDFASEDDFGDGLSIYGNVAVVSSPGDDDNGSNSGSVYIYVKPGTGWEDMSETVKISASDGQPGDRFGTGVDIYEDQIIVGAYQGTGQDYSTGSAYIYEKPAGGWASLTTETAILTASDGVNHDLFGKEVSIWNDVAVIGAYWDDDNGNNSGSAYVYVKPPAGWVNSTESAKLLPSDGIAGGAFGLAIDMVDTLIVIGAYGSNKAYVFEEPSTGWANSTETGILSATGSSAFGISVQIGSDEILVGSNSNDGGGVFHFIKPVDGWTSVNATRMIVAAEVSNSDNFGNKIAYNGSDLLIGAPGDDDVGNTSGAVYLYRFVPNQAPVFTAGGDQTLLEDAGETTVKAWATNIGDGEQGIQTLTFNISNDNNELFEVQPTLDSITGDLTFTPADGASGIANISLSLSDDGGTDNSGSDTSEEVSFVITVEPINDAPSFTSGGDVELIEDYGEKTFEAWATSIQDGDDNSQTLSFVVENSNNTLFSVQPDIDPTTGDLTLTTAENANGLATVYIKLKDDGGTDSDGVDSSSTQSFSIRVIEVNDAPTFTGGGGITILEDAGAQTIPGWASGISDGDHGSQNLTFNLLDADYTLFSNQPTINSSTGDLTFTPASDANGSMSISVYLSDNGGTSNDGIDKSDTVTFNLTIEAVNDAPSFTKGSDQTVPENSGYQTIEGWASNLDDGDEGTQELTFNVINDNNFLFDAQPAIDASGTLTYKPASNITGSATVTVSLSDNGGTETDGIDTSTESTFTIIIVAINHAPSFTTGDDVTVYEGSGEQTLESWATEMSDGDDEDQALTFNVTNDNNALFTVQPAVDPLSGDLTFTVASETTGSANVSLSLSDDGGTENGGSDTSAEITFSISVLGINHAPSFTPGADQHVLEDAGAQTVVGWATDITDSDDGIQAVWFNVSNDNNQLFATQPSLSADGDLDFTPAANAFGSARVSVSLRDDGGAENGGDDESDEVIFTIAVTSVNDRPVFSAGPDQTIDEDAGAQTVQNWASGITDGDDTSQALSFTLSSDNDALFAVQPEIDAATGDLTYTPASNSSGEAIVTAILSDSGGTENGGENTSESISFTITVNPVYDMPAFVAGGDQTILEDAGQQLVTDWASEISFGDGAGGDPGFIVTNDNNALFEVQPAVDTDGKLSYSTASNATGEAVVAVTLVLTNGSESESSEPATFNIAILEVNDAPEFLVGDDIVVSEDAGTQTISGWATGISDGDSNGQALSFILSNDNETLFTDQPAVNPETGDLTFVPADNAAGTAHVAIMLTDDGGKENGGIDESAELSFTITIDPVNDAPFDLVLTGNSIKENQPIGTKIGDITVKDIDSNDHTFTLTGEGAESFDITGSEIFSKVEFDFESKSSYLLTLEATDDNAKSPLSISISVEIMIIDVEDLTLSLNTPNFTPSIYPNPATNYLTIDYDNHVSGRLKITLLDLSGKAVHTQDHSEPILVEQIPSGTYILRIEDEDTVWKDKVRIKH